MQGLELAKRYYEEVGRPMLERDFPELLPRLAAGLVGEGSECLGFDDAISQDHDFGAGFCLWFSAEDYNQYGNAHFRMPMTVCQGSLQVFRTPHKCAGRRTCRCV